MRPKKPKQHQMSYQLSPELHEELRAYARREQISVSDVVRYAVRGYLNARKNQAKEAVTP